MNNERLFDQLIKDKLEEMHIVQPDNAWNRFSRATKMNAAREGHFFDQAVSRSLSNVSAPLAGNEWHQFKDHWDNYAHHVENQFDSQIRTGIQSAGLSPDPKAFEILESALSQSNIRNKNLIPSKIIEAILMSVIILLLSMYMPLLQQNKPVEQLNEMQNNKQVNPVPSDRAENLPASEFNRAHQIFVNSSNEATVVYHRNVTSEYKNARTMRSNSGNSKLTGLGKEVTMQVNDPNTISGIINNSERPALNHETNNSDQFNTTHSSLDVKNGILLSDNARSSLATIEFNKLYQNDVNPRSLFASELYPNYNAIPIKMTAGKNLLSAIWLGLKIGRAFDMIKTPSYSESAKLFSAQRVQSTILAFNVEIKNDYVNLETGINYSKKTFGSSGSENETAHFINIPLSIKKDFFPENKIVPYFKVGPDITIVAAAVYRTYNETSTAIPKGGNSLAPDLTFTDKVEDGIVNSGKLSNNSFMGIHGSLGFEAKLNNYSKITFDVSQQINPFEKGIGINNHRFSETSISIGYKRLLFENLY